MSYRFFEDFSRWDDEKKPYSLFSEETVRYDIPDGRIEEKGYRILRPYVKQLLCTPDLDSFSLKLAISFGKSSLYKGNTIKEWSVFFGYSRKERCGNALRFSYLHDEGTLTVSLLNVTAIGETERQSRTLEGITLQMGVEYLFRLEVTPSTVTLFLEDRTLAFDTVVKSGMVAIRTQKGAEGIFFRHIALSSTDNVSAVDYGHTVMTVPCFDGGEVDYTVDLQARSYENGICEMTCTLDGGAYYRKKRMQNTRDWSAPYEHLQDPYIRLIQGNRISHKQYLKNGKLYFVAKDYGKHELEIRLDAAEMPYRVTFYGEALPQYDAIAFGYTKKQTFTQEFFGGKREFVFSPDGTLLYDGEPLGKECFSELTSGDDKQIIDLFPQNISERDKAIAHARRNHTFLQGENVRFSAYLHTTRCADRLHVRVELTDAFFKTICDVPSHDTETVAHTTDRWGYATRKTSLAVPELAQGVYHLRVTWLYGDTVCHTHESAFEIIDPASSLSPQQSAGLPLMYVGDGTMHVAVPDMWNPKRDCSIEHYFDCAQYCPESSEAKRPWELLRIYHRSVFVWMTQRTVGKRSFEDFPLSTQNADYLNYHLPAVSDSHHYNRCDVWSVEIYDSPTVQEIFEKFRETHPQYRHVLEKIPSHTPLTIEHLKSMMPHCFDDWATFFNAENDRLLAKQWQEIKMHNPKVKRSDYGPFPLYGTHLAGGYHTKWFGADPKTMAKHFDGFFQFEDYPFVCAYGTHYSAWGMMTVKQLSPDARIAPELYDCFDAVCPDGFVAGAHPPLGESYAEPYMTVTQVYEYLYNTPVLRANGAFSYWQDDCLMFYSLYMKEPEARMKQFLRAWGDYRENRPVSPKRSIAYLAEFDTADNRRETDVQREALYNICQSGESYLHACAAEAGLPAGFVVDFSSLDHLNAEMTDVLVIPSLRLASEKAKETIKRLYNAGVPLVAVGDVSGLEDIFGVKKDERVAHVSRVTWGEQSEHIFPYDAEFFYAPNGAETVLYADDSLPVLMRKGSAVLLNCSVNQVGVDNYKPLCYYGRPNISKLLKQAVSGILCELSRPYAKADGRCGVTSFTTENGDTDLLLVDYSPYNELSDKEVCVALFDRDVRDITCISRPDVSIGKYFEGNILKECRITMKHHEALLLRLEKQNEKE